MKKHKEGIAVMHSFSISYPETYRNNNKGYGRADALYALVLYGALMLAFLGLGLGFRLLGDALTAGIVYLGEGIVTLLLFLLVFLVCRRRGQRFSSIGLGREPFLASIKGACAVLTAVISIVAVCFLLGARCRYSFEHSMIRLWYYTFIIAATEELFFRGYMGTRFYGALGGSRWSVVITAVLFALLHIPFQAAFAGVPVTEYLVMVWGQLLFTFCFHIVMQWCYARKESLLVPILIHAFWNFLPEVLFFS